MAKGSGGGSPPGEGLGPPPPCPPRGTTSRSTHWVGVRSFSGVQSEVSGSSFRIEASLRVDTKPPKEGEGVRVSWRQAMASGARCAEQRAQQSQHSGMEVRGSEVQGHLWLHSEFQASLGVLADDWGSIPSIHMVLTTPITPVPEDPRPCWTAWPPVTAPRQAEWKGLLPRRPIPCRPPSRPSRGAGLGARLWEGSKRGEESTASWGKGWALRRNHDYWAREVTGTRLAQGHVNARQGRGRVGARP